MKKQLSVLILVLLASCSSMQSRDDYPRLVRKPNPIEELPPLEITVSDDGFSSVVAYETSQQDGQATEIDRPSWSVIGLRDRKTNQRNFTVSYRNRYTDLSRHSLGMATLAGGTPLVTHVTANNLMSEAFPGSGLIIYFAQMNIDLTSQQIEAARQSSLAIKIWGEHAAGTIITLQPAVVSALLDRMDKDAPEPVDPPKPTKRHKHIQGS